MFNVSEQNVVASDVTKFSDYNHIMNGFESASISLIFFF